MNSAIIGRAEDDIADISGSWRQVSFAKDHANLDKSAGRISESFGLAAAAIA